MVRLHTQINRQQQQSQQSQKESIAVQASEDDIYQSLKNSQSVSQPQHLVIEHFSKEEGVQTSDQSNHNSSSQEEGDENNSIYSKSSQQKSDDNESQADILDQDELDREKRESKKKKRKQMRKKFRSQTRSVSQKREKEKEPEIQRKQQLLGQKLGLFGTRIYLFGTDAQDLEKHVEVMEMNLSKKQEKIVLRYQKEASRSLFSDLFKLEQEKKEREQQEKEFEIQTMEILKKYDLTMQQNILNEIQKYEEKKQKVVQIDDSTSNEVQEQTQQQVEQQKQLQLQQSQKQKQQIDTVTESLEEKNKKLSQQDLQVKLSQQQTQQQQLQKMPSPNKWHEFLSQPQQKQQSQQEQLPPLQQQSQKEQKQTQQDKKEQKKQQKIIDSQVLENFKSKNKRSRAQLIQQLQQQQQQQDLDSDDQEQMEQKVKKRKKHNFILTELPKLEEGHEADECFIVKTVPPKIQKSRQRCQYDMITEHDPQEQMVQNLKDKVGNLTYQVRNKRDSKSYGNFDKDAPDHISKHKMNYKVFESLHKHNQSNNILKIQYYFYKVEWKSRPSGRKAYGCYYSYQELKRCCPRILLEYIEKLGQLLR